MWRHRTYRPGCTLSRSMALQALTGSLEEIPLALSPASTSMRQTHHSSSIGTARYWVTAGLYTVAFHLMLQVATIRSRHRLLNVRKEFLANQPLAQDVHLHGSSLVRINRSLTHSSVGHQSTTQSQVGTRQQRKARSRGRYASVQVQHAPTSRTMRVVEPPA